MKKFKQSQVNYAFKKLEKKARSCGFTKKALTEGMNVEREHADVTGGGALITAKIAAAHLCERTDYYKRIKKYVEPKGHIGALTPGPDALGRMSIDFPGVVNVAGTRWPYTFTLTKVTNNHWSLRNDDGGEYQALRDSEVRTLVQEGHVPVRRGYWYSELELGPAERQQLSVLIDQLEEQGQMSGLGDASALKCPRGEVPVCTPRFMVPGLSGLGAVERQVSSDGKHSLQFQATAVDARSERSTGNYSLYRYDDDWALFRGNLILTQLSTRILREAVTSGFLYVSQPWWHGYIHLDPEVRSTLSVWLDEMEEGNLAGFGTGTTTLTLPATMWSEKTEDRVGGHWVMDPTKGTASITVHGDGSISLSFDGAELKRFTSYTEMMQHFDGEQFHTSDPGRFWGHTPSVQFEDPGQVLQWFDMMLESGTLSGWKY